MAEPNTDSISKPVGLVTRMFYWWADRPLAQAFVLVSMSTIAMIGYLQPSLILDWVASADSAVEDPSPQTKHRRGLPGPTGLKGAAAKVEPFQVAGGECVLVARSDDFFTAAGLTAMRSVASELSALPQVRSVLWLDDIPDFNVFGLSGTLLPSSHASARQLEATREQVLRNPLAVGQLISPDGKTLLLHLELDWFFVTNDDAATIEIREQAERAVQQVGGVDIDFQLTGPVPLHLMTVENHVANSRQYQLYGYAIMLLSALFLFRGLAAVLLVAVAPAMGVFWTMGMLHFFDLQDNPFNDIIVPILISLVGLTDAVHLMVEIRSQRAAGRSVRDATRQGIARVGLACVLTSLTTAIGFISLTFAHHEIVQDFGWCCVLGVAMTLVSVLTVIPLGCRSPLGRRLHVGLGKSMIDGQLKRIDPLVGWVLRHDRVVAGAAIVATAVLALISLNLQPDEKRYSGLSESAEAAQALRHLDQSLGGLEFGFVSVNWSEQADEGDLLVVLQEVDDALRQESLIGHPLGLHQLLAALPGDGDAAERMTLLELLPQSLKRAFYQPEGRSAWVQFRVQDLGIAAYGEVFPRIESRLNEVMGEYPGYSLALEGDAPWRWRNVYRIVTDLATSLGTASIVIWLVLTVVYRSIRIGLISIVPNLFPLAATGTLLVLSGQHLELVTVCVFTICIGIAVDDTIHFLTRYQEEQQLGGDHEDVIRRAFTGVGSALLMTTIVLVAGMLTAVVADARDARLFGIMGCLTLTTALFADVVLLPALLSRFSRPRSSRKSSRCNAKPGNISPLDS
ncbi:efflux RND transporter permease subunit [Allorhodopirellula heiligendammensis]|uniref:Multidrug resistance protein MdtC n=1 Tax=Allorhodopirellula heiligendammensis TaxID=2714739 RepID=A0A5C6BVA2_9BACT|nr:efflux RND transporter permease subunit [Allorhodopirellula heiligendammensis]TWU16210.1 Multidrug resistance protein MdtC [Allorhodopirellula heiligendammensis]